MRLRKDVSRRYCTCFREKQLICFSTSSPGNPNVLIIPEYFDFEDLEYFEVQ